MIRRFLAGIVSLTLSTVACADALNSIILVGEKDQVLQLIAKAIDAEFNNGTRTSYSDGVGYRTRFNSFLTGASELTVYILPMGKGESVQADGYGLEFRWQTQRQDGRRHALAIVNQIIEQGSKQTVVTIDRNVSNYKTSNEQSGKCTSRLADDPELKSIADKVGLGGPKDQTFAMQANETLPTDEEKKIIMIWATKRDACAKGTKIQFTFWPNDPNVPIIQALLDTANQLILGLYKGALTYGQFAKFRSDANNRYVEARQKIAAEMQAKNVEANERARRASMEAARLMIEEQRAINERYKPPAYISPQTTQTNCRTVRLGDSLQTTCS